MKVQLSTLIIALLIIPTKSFSASNEQDLLIQLTQQQQQIKTLQNEIKSINEALKSTDEKVEITASAVETTMTSTATNKTSIGGYGELHYNNIEDTETIDFHRFVLFFNHEFSKSIRLFSELEVEHSIAGEGKKGEVELEQAYIEIDLTQSTSLKTGLFLVPVGIMNETHEPTTFYGVERNPVEKNIIPATWWEAGVGFSTRFSEGWSADLAVHSGLNVATLDQDAFLIRNGRTKVSKAPADSLAYTARIKYTAIAGLELAASYQIQDDVTQGELDAGANLLTAHIIYNKGNFGLKALYASWDIDGTQTQLLGRDEQSGYYVEPSFKLNQNWGIFARYNAWDNNAGSNSINNLETEKKQTNIGINFWLHENVVFKFDIENRSGAHTGNGFNLGVGYHF